MNPAGLALLLAAAIPMHPFAYQVLDDGRDLATAPLRWHGREWRRFAEGSAAVVAAFAVDNQIVRFVSRQQNRELDRYLRGVTHLGGGYGVDLAAVLAVGGLPRGGDRVDDGGVRGAWSAISSARAGVPR